MARLTRARLHIEDHGILTILLDFVGETDGWGQSYGGYGMGARDHGFGSACIKEILEAYGKTDWDELRDLWTWVERGDEPAGWSTRITRVQPVGSDRVIDFAAIADRHKAAQHG